MKRIDERKLAGTSSRRHLHPPSGFSKVAGFSLFELVVFIICAAILYAYAANRFSDFPGQAERANFLAIATQLQTALNLEVMLGVGSRNLASPAVLEGANPMELLLQPPSNYLGSFSAPDTSTMDRRIWYFDRNAGELVYLVNDNDGVFYLLGGAEIPTSELRMHIVADYGEYDTVTGLPVAVLASNGNEVAPENRETRLNGILLRPVTPYRWGEVAPSMLLDEALGDTSLESILAN